MNTELPKEKFESYALVELFGHTRIVGMVTEQSLGGASFIRVDVPNPDGTVAYTRIYGAAAVFSINPISRAVALELAQGCDARPVAPYEVPRLTATTTTESVVLTADDQDPNEEGEL
jgi:hypothetical protein